MDIKSTSQSAFIGGIATLLQTIGVPFFGYQLPLVQGVSFASVATVVAIVTTGGADYLLCSVLSLPPLRWAF